MTRVPTNDNGNSVPARVPGGNTHERCEICHRIRRSDQQENIHGPRSRVTSPDFCPGHLADDRRQDSAESYSNSSRPSSSRGPSPSRFGLAELVRGAGARQPGGRRFAISGQGTGSLPNPPQLSSSNTNAVGFGNLSSASPGVLASHSSAHADKRKRCHNRAEGYEADLDSDSAGEMSTRSRRRLSVEDDDDEATRLKSESSSNRRIFPAVGRSGAQRFRSLRESGYHRHGGSTTPAPAPRPAGGPATAPAAGTAGAPRPAAAPLPGGAPAPTPFASFSWPQNLPLRPKRDDTDDDQHPSPKPDKRKEPKV
ncbi:hypothetical protein QBC35DRAFT_287074 [Podospora australis]|uniref:Uncharacterized protein n=1 Tax=Podospora australis TaxID=1536484 RepID=A0AAN6WQ16_9PEZI|nr:hypothetical protein QBC35DRAFT_287074 [Podospora australis]